MRPLALLLGLGLLVACGGSDRDNRGGLCGVAGIEGTRVDDVSSSNPACGIDDPVEVTRVSGVALSQPALMTCETARALNRWTAGAAIPEVGRRGGGLARLEVAAHYVCRTRNSRRGARISEHGKGNAIDISALTLADGSQITVAGGWSGPRRDSRLLRRLHRAACGPFGTVLGPRLRPVPPRPFPFRRGAPPGWSLLPLSQGVPASG